MFRCWRQVAKNSYLQDAPLMINFPGIASWPLVAKDRPLLWSDKAVVLVRNKYFPFFEADWKYFWFSLTPDFKVKRGEERFTWASVTVLARGVEEGMVCGSQSSCILCLVFHFLFSHSPPWFFTSRRIIFHIWSSMWEEGRERGQSHAHFSGCVRGNGGIITHHWQFQCWCHQISYPYL